MTPAQEVALPDAGAPPPPDGYTEVSDEEATLANFSATVRAHRSLGLPPIEAQQNVARPLDTPPLFDIDGFPIRFNAPVNTPYLGGPVQPVSYNPANGEPDFAYELHQGEPGHK
jgi:hypothetical protein